MSPCVSYYNNLFLMFNVSTAVCDWYFHHLTYPILSVQHLISSAFVSDVYGLIQHILYLIFVAPYYNVTMTLVQHCVISNGTLYGISYLKAELLSSITLSPTFLTWYTILVFLRMLSLLIFTWFRWHINTQSTVCFIGRIISWPNTNWTVL